MQLLKENTSTKFSYKMEMGIKDFIFFSGRIIVAFSAERDLTEGNNLEIKDLL